MNSIYIGSFYRWGMLENYSRHIVQVMKGRIMRSLNVMKYYKYNVEKKANVIDKM